MTMTWNLLLILGVVLVLISVWGEWLGGVVDDIATYHPTTLSFNPSDTRKSEFKNAATDRNGTPNE